MSKSILNPFSQMERKTETILPATNSWNIPFGGGGWSFPGSAMSTSSSSGQLIQSPSTNNIPNTSASTSSAQSVPPSTTYPQPIILMSPTWNGSNSHATNPAQCHFSFVNETENLHVTITNNSRGSITTHLIGRGTKFSFIASADQELSINVVSTNDSASGIVAQVDNDPFNLRAKNK